MFRPRSQIYSWLPATLRKAEHYFDQTYTRRLLSFESPGRVGCTKRSLQNFWQFEKKFMRKDAIVFKKLSWKSKFSRREPHGYFKHEGRHRLGPFPACF